MVSSCINEFIWLYLIFFNRGFDEFNQRLSSFNIITFSIIQLSNSPRILGVSNRDCIQIHWKSLFHEAMYCWYEQTKLFLDMAELTSGVTAHRVKAHVDCRVQMNLFNIIFIIICISLRILFSTYFAFAEPWSYAQELL